MHLLKLALVVLLFSLATACAAAVGDECSSNTDCGRELVCDTSMPGGYCTRSNCETSSCPEEGVCIEFPDQSRFCMLRCEGGSDCRDGYQCVSNWGDLPFCSAAPYSEAQTTPAN